MEALKLRLKLLSPSLIGSAEGFGAIIDSDIVFDEHGITFIPSKRLRGLLRDSANEVLEMFYLSGINLIPFKRKEDSFDIIDELFGEAGQSYSSPLFISNLYIIEYENLSSWISYLTKKFSNFVNPERVRNYFTEIRQQTSIDEEKGVAKKHSLRTIRVAKKGLEFEGYLHLYEKREDFRRLLYFACLNLRRFGTRRTRGFGEIECRLFNEQGEIDYFRELEVLQ
ncbi:MAG: RAMP superfamily CRISPR-associated protein [Thermodesulfovibrio sp.]|nr:RAMP superfamily CRISPR-associated protein [Thermodesulfovibrio sp.]